MVCGGAASAGDVDGCDAGLSDDSRTTANAHGRAPRLQIKRVYPTLTSLPSLSIIRSIDEQMIDFSSVDDLALMKRALTH
ncbi:protein of unknown function [Pararobbsia alpina]